MHSQRITFAGSQGEPLAARLDLPQGTVRAFALFAHCFTCSKDGLAAARIAGALAEKDIAVLRFDFTGLGGSGGDFANTDFSSNVADLVQAASYLRTEHGPPALLIGHSLGGAAVLAAAHKIPDVQAVATIGAPADTAHVTSHFNAARTEIESRGEAEVEIAGRTFRIRKDFLDDIEAQSLQDSISALRKPLLIFHAPQDDVVGIENAEQIYQAAKHPKSFVSLDGADHLLSRKADAAWVAGVLSSWAARYIGAVEPKTETAAPTDFPNEGLVAVAETGEGRFTQKVHSGRHILVADEPRAVGGDDLGPGPYEYLLAGLGACTSMTIRMYAERKGWPLERVAVRLGHTKVHAEDCADCETEKGKIDEITREIAIEGALDDEQRQRLLEIADRCPVHRTLTSEVKIRTRAVRQ